MADEELDQFDAREADQAEVREARQLEELNEAEKVRQLARILAQEDVRDYLWRLLCSCNVYSSVANANFGTMSLLEGRRQVGLQLLAEICEADPSAEMSMRKKAIGIAAEKKRLAELKLMRRRARSNSTSL
jgi:hypothetical protein